MKIILSSYFVNVHALHNLTINEIKARAGRIEDEIILGEYSAQNPRLFLVSSPKLKEIKTYFKKINE